MPALSDKDVAQLRKRGIEIEKDSFGTRYVFSLQGLYWLFNHLYDKPTQGKKQRLTVGLLKELANVPAGKNWRLLRAKAAALPVYSDTYLQLAFYLNGSPPKLLHNLAAHPGIEQQVPFLERSNILCPVQNTEAVWRLTEDEQKKLSAGEHLEFGQAN